MKTQYPNFTLNYLGTYQRSIYIEHMGPHLHFMRKWAQGCIANKIEVKGVQIQCKDGLFSYRTNYLDKYFRRAEASGKSGIHVEKVQLGKKHPFKIALADGVAPGSHSN